MKEKVLEIEIIKVNEDWSVWYITHQNEEVLPRGEFKDDELSVCSGYCPMWSKVNERLYILGTHENEDSIPCIINTTDVPLLKEKVEKINEKYGIERFEIERAKENEFYYFIDYFNPEDLIQKSVECGCSIDDNLYYLKNYFLDKEEAIACEKHLRNETIKFRKEWKRNKG